MHKKANDQPMMVTKEGHDESDKSLKDINEKVKAKGTLSMYVHDFTFQLHTHSFQCPTL